MYSNYFKFLSEYRKIRFNRLKQWKSCSILLGMFMLIGILCLAAPERVSAVCGSTGVPSDTLTIKVGYYGGPYYTKKVYTLNDFDKLPQVEQAYTYIDNMPAICIDSAKGVKLTDLLENAGIDINSVQKFYFYCTDIKVGWYECKDKSFLLDTPRYYYPNLPSCWDYDKQKAKPDATSGAVKVDAIIAYKDNWQRYADKPDFSNFDTSTRFRLLFGQTDTTGHNASESAKWVHTIEIMLGGMPPSKVTLNQNIANVKVGSTIQLTADVAPYKATDKSVTWSSSDTSVATVDSNGKVTVVGKGTAAITVSTIVGSFKASCVINGPVQSTDTHSAIAAGTGSQNGGTGKTDRSEASAGKQIAQSDQQRLTEKKAGEAGKAGKTAAGGRQEGAVGPTEQEGGVQPWRVFMMSPDATPLQQQKEQNNYNIYAGAIFMILFLSGAIKRYREYIRETIIYGDGSQLT